MGCNHGVQAEAPGPAPLVRVSPPSDELISLEADGATLLGRIGDRSPTRARAPDKVEEAKGTLESAPKNKLQLPLAKESDEVRLAQMEIESLCRAVSEQLPHTGGNICVLGGCEIHHPETRPLIQAVAKRLVEAHSDRDVSVLTGGLPGVQEQMVKSLSSHGFQQITNLVHFGQERGQLGTNQGAAMP
eukprot:s1780_g21.t1